MSASLEDYLETIYLLVQEQGFARVKDIARARDVRAASVSIALRKLAELELVRYERREYIALTAAGEQAGRRVLARHRLLTRFFQEVLSMPSDKASERACAMEHSLTDEAMDRLVRFLEFLANNPAIIESFHQCPLSGPAAPLKGRAAIDHHCPACVPGAEARRTLADLKPGQSATVAHIKATGALRQRLLDMGILPSQTLELERLGLGGDPLWIRCQGTSLALRRAEARTILVRQSG
jgi:DtxR family Mn-dependent transcriptional regulator